MLYIPGDHFAGTSLCPISPCEHLGNRIDIEPRQVGADGEVILMDLKQSWHGASLSWVIISLYRAERREPSKLKPPSSAACCRNTCAEDGAGSILCKPALR